MWNWDGDTIIMRKGHAALIIYTSQSLMTFAPASQFTFSYRAALIYLKLVQFSRWVLWFELPGCRAAADQRPAIQHPTIWYKIQIPGDKKWGRGERRTLNIGHTKIMTATFRTEASTHGIMGRRFPDGGSLRYRKWVPQQQGDVNKQGSGDSRPIGGESVTTITSPSCWGTRFLYLSNPPSGNLLPIFPCC